VGRVCPQHGHRGRPLNSIVRPQQPNSIAVMIAKIADIKPLLARGRIKPEAVFRELRQLAATGQWQTREVAATALVENRQTPSLGGRARSPAVGQGR